MTPQQITDYKRQWKMGDHYVVRIHSDLRSVAKEWCKQLDKHQWDFKSFTNVYEDTFFFEDQNVSQQFEEEFIEWIQ